MSLAVFLAIRRSAKQPALLSESTQDMVSLAPSTQRCRCCSVGYQQIRELNPKRLQTVFFFFPDPECLFTGPWRSLHLQICSRPLRRHARDLKDSLELLSEFCCEADV